MSNRFCGRGSTLVILGSYVFISSCQEEKAESAISVDGGKTPLEAEAASNERGKSVVGDNGSGTPERVSSLGRVDGPGKNLKTSTKDEGFVILEDMSSIVVEPGMPSPKVGDRLYSISSLPNDRCGEFWVKNSDGTVAKIAVCTGDHEGGH